ncbi:bifunctional glycosyltransferase 87/phosphatase PAP2 family protein [Streptomyces sp. NPDC005438]|uniref:bifunctional glycosyltransferase 87/phosphatase PAP2 family protein n=1 Tax=Streptomyces sp. NPDC005438 TaxID=3156880 RepID=UPI0033A24907
MALIGLWLLALTLAVRQAAVVLSRPADERLTDLLAWIGDHGVLTAGEPLYAEGTFTGTPFAGLVLKPLTRAAQAGLGVAWTLGTLLLVAAVAWVAVRALPGRVSPRASLFATPVALCLLTLSLPVRNTFTLGQTSILPVLLVLIGWLHSGRDRQWGGALIGVAAALQPAVLLFAPLLWLTGRRPAALAAGGTFATATLAAWIAMPGDSWTYWVHHLAGSGLGEAADGLSNQSLHGVLLRLGLRGPLELGLLAVLVAAVAVVALRRAVHYARDGQLLLSAAVLGCGVVACSPTMWQHQQLWILLALVGRLGQRGPDRLVWPILVVLVMTLDGSALLPAMPALSPLAENLPLLAALAVACALPFLSTKDPTFDAPLAPRVPERPHLLLELLLIRVGYWAYSYVRSLAPDGRDTAEAHGRQILDWEAALHIDVEHTLNNFAAQTPWLENSANFYYSAFHFLVPISLLAFLYVRRPLEYRKARTSLSVATLLGVVGFYLYPLAPPRLMPGLGYVDTAHGPQDLSDPDFGALTELSNQYAAMPSLHVGWSLWCAVVIVRMTSKYWLRALGMLYPMLTVYVVMATANHYILDAAGGALVVTVGMLLGPRLPKPGPLWKGSTEPDPVTVPAQSSAAEVPEPERPEPVSKPAPEPAPVAERAPRDERERVDAEPTGG